MSNTSPPLKWLVEKRARVAAQLARAERRASCLPELLAAAEAKAHQAANALKQAEGLRDDLEGLDRTLALHTPDLDSSAISPVDGWQGRYGRRGALRESIIELLKERRTGWYRSEELTSAVALKWRLDLATPAERRAWVSNSLRGALKVLTAEGLVECRHDPGSTRTRCLWRWKPEMPQTLASLHAGASLH